ncbi:hypothetical protein [Streptomyces odontomachi]|uniref:hypothetical protein n=1 Tax=Streptomyces odontomachi TaxID=2944940 RepID=UPI00210A64DA|nr:hypothetical protein [Streptomyces sp. ODS25]
MDNTGPAHGESGLPPESRQDIEELEFSPLEPEEAAALDDRLYLLGCRTNTVRNG